MRKYCAKIIFGLATVLLLLTSAYAAELTINLIAVNPSETDTKEIDVKYYLPQELEPTDVLDSGPLKVEYDVEKVSYYVTGKVSFAPKESRTFKIRVNDVWVITPEEVKILTESIDGGLSLLKSRPEVYANAKRERDKIVEQLEYILSQQIAYSDNIDRRIEQYRADAGVVEKLRKKIYDPNFLDKEAQVAEDEEVKTVKFVLQVRNPSTEKEKKIKHKHYLPTEIRSEDVLERQGFDIHFDEKKGKAFLEKEEDFAAGEEKRYELTLKDVWRFPVQKLEPIENRATLAMPEIKESAYASSGQYLFEDMVRNLNLIRESQNFEVTPEEHIGIFRINQKRYDEAKESMERIEQMLAIVRAKKLEELEGSKVKNVLKRLQALRGLQALSEALFKKGISVTMTWRIIFGCIIFVALFTTIHFILWARRSGTSGESIGNTTGEPIKVVPKPGEPAKTS